MSIATVVTEGFGSFGTVGLVVTQGFGIGAYVPPVVVDDVDTSGGKGKRRKKQTIKINDRPMTVAEALMEIQGRMAEIERREVKTKVIETAPEEIRTLIEEPTKRVYQGLVPKVSHIPQVNARYEELALLLEGRNKVLRAQLESYARRIAQEIEDEEELLILFS